MLWPARIVTGSDRPPTLNTELFEVASVTVTLVPLAVRLPEAIPLFPVTTLPRPSVVGETANCPMVVVPVPDKGIVKVVSDVVDAIVTFPVMGPVDCGLNEILKLVL